MAIPHPNDISILSIGISRPRISLQFHVRHAIFITDPSILATISPHISQDSTLDCSEPRRGFRRIGHSDSHFIRCYRFYRVHCSICPVLARHYSILCCANSFFFSSVLEPSFILEKPKNRKSVITTKKISLAIRRLRFSLRFLLFLPPSPPHPHRQHLHPSFLLCPPNGS
jgi:hypothetical protein